MINLGGDVLLAGGSVGSGPVYVVHGLSTQVHQVDVGAAVVCLMGAGQGPSLCMVSVFPFGSKIASNAHRATFNRDSNRSGCPDSYARLGWLGVFRTKI
jgi:hypothetical protein